MGYFWLTIVGITFIFVMTTLGASIVFFFKKEISPKINATFLGFASGVMLAASVWSLLLPAIAQAENVFKTWSFLPVAIGFVIGGLFLVLLDKLSFRHTKTGMDSHSNKHMRLFLAVTLHNIPEGLAVGFAFGAAAQTGVIAAYLSALGLAFGIGVQNFPEGAAVSLPMKQALQNNRKAFFQGVLSGVAEPIFAVLGYFLASVLQVLQSWLLAFSAGAMVFVAAEDLIPDSHLEESPRLGAWGVLLGFALMMSLDVALGR